jgi:hypothetical protein
MGGVLAVTMLLGVGVAAAQADLPDNDIVIKPAGRADDGGNDVVVGSRQPAITVQFNFGSTTDVHVECMMDSQTFSTCGTQITSNCPASQCWLYQPAFTSDGTHTVAAAIFDSTLPDNDPNQPMDELVQTIVIDSTLPDTRLSSIAPTFDMESANRKGVPAYYNVQTIDDADPILYEDTSECAITTGSAPRSWVDCTRTLRVPPTTQAFRFWARAVDFLGRLDPTPVESPPFSAIACRARLLSRPRSLGQIARRGLRVRLSCLQPTSYHVALQMPLKETIALNERYRDVTSQFLGSVNGRCRQGESAVVTLHLLHGIPADLFAYRPLSLDLDTTAGIDTPFVIHKVTGR